MFFQIKCLGQFYTGAAVTTATAGAIADVFDDVSSCPDDFRRF